MSISSRMQSTVRPLALSVAGLTLGAGGGQALAQSNGKGSYQGTISVTGTMDDSQVKYQARIKVALPITESDRDSITAGLDADIPNGTVEITQWDETRGGGAPDGEGGGEAGVDRCTLKSPMTIPIMVQGVLEVDLKRSVHDFSVSVVSLSDFELDCVNSRSGPHKKTLGFSLSPGTGVPGSQYETKLPFTDAANLTGQYTLDPTEYTQGGFGPIAQKWEFHRQN